MTAPHADQLIDGYLARLRVAAADLPPSQRAELIEDMRSHIAEARSREPDETDASILNILDRLGDPTSVAAAAGGGSGLVPQAPHRRPMTLGESFRRYAQGPLLGCLGAILGFIVLMVIVNRSLVVLGHVWILVIVLSFPMLVAVLAIWVARALFDRTT